MSQEVSPDYRDELKDCFKAMSGDVYATLRRLTRGDEQLSEDLVQETFRKAWERWDDLRDLTQEERGRWLTRVAVNTAISVFRRDERAREKMPMVWANYHPPEPDAHRDALTSIAIERFIALINDMPAKRGHVAFLYWRCGWTNSEIAKALGISRGGVTQHIGAARKTLRKELGPYVPFEPSETEGGAGHDQEA